MHTCVCMHTHTHARTHARTHAHTHTHTHTHTRVSCPYHITTDEKIQSVVDQSQNAVQVVAGIVYGWSEYCPCCYWCSLLLISLSLESHLVVAGTAKCWSVSKCCPGNWLLLVRFVVDQSQPWVKYCPGCCKFSQLLISLSKIIFFIKDVLVVCRYDWYRRRTQAMYMPWRSCAKPTCWRKTRWV